MTRKEKQFRAYYDKVTALSVTRLQKHIHQWLSESYAVIERQLFERVDNRLQRDLTTRNLVRASMRRAVSNGCRPRDHVGAFLI